ncbi:MAG TPA: GNAT family N-acetyltransferase [Trebonia sp.]|jgi:RimJ/RimL family protein N-acetyltransferase
MTQLPTMSAREVTAGRLLLREARDGDRDGLIELQTDPRVRAYLARAPHRGRGELELSYVLRRGAWGAGLAFEAAAAALRAAAAQLPGRPVLVVTQTANRSLRLAARPGFQPVSTFEEFGAEQTLAAARLWAFRA